MRAHLRLARADAAVRGAELAFELVEPRFRDAAGGLELLGAVEALADLVALCARLFEVGARLVDVGPALLAPRAR